MFKHAQSLQMEEIEANAMDVMIEVHTQALYDEIFKAMEVFGKCGSFGLRPEGTVYTKYKIGKKGEASSNTIAI